jgi:hypothetical protein
MLQNKKAGRVKVLEQSGQWLEIRSGWLGIRSNHILHDVTYKCFLFFCELYFDKAHFLVNCRVMTEKVNID